MGGILSLRNNRETQYLHKYLKKLKGFDKFKAKDIIKAINELRVMSGLVYDNIVNNNKKLFKSYIEINQTLIEFYEKLPTIDNVENKMSVENALEVLFGSDKEEEEDYTEKEEKEDDED